MRGIWLRKAGSHLYIWFVFYVSLPNQIKLLLFNIFFFEGAGPPSRDEDAVDALGQQEAGA